MANYLLSRIILLHVFLENEDVLKAANILCDCYMQSRYIPPDDDWPPYHPKHYTPLTVVHHQGRCTESEVENTAQKLNTAGISKRNKTCDHIHQKSIKELLAPFEEAPCIILIEGGPCIGKTIISKEIAFQWANKDVLKNMNILFLLFMRDPRVKYITDVSSLVKFFFQSDTLTKRITDWLIETSGKYLTIVIDGYDEMSKENISHSIISRIINREILPKCVGIITSRSGASSDLHNKVTCRAEILGFSTEDRLGFIQNALKGQVDKIKGLKGFLQSNPSINGLCYIPLNMSILLCLTAEGINGLPKTQTGLYKKFILMTIVHFLKKDKSLSTPTLKSLDDLPHPYDQVVKELSEFAFLALKEHQLVFTMTEVKAKCSNVTPGYWYGLGLLKPAHYFKPNDACDCESFHFLHYSIQEYLAAYHIASLSDNNRLSRLLRETFWNVQYFNTWVMYVDLTGGKSFEFMHFLSGNYFRFQSHFFGTQSISSTILCDKIKCLQLLRCSAETSHDMLSSVEAIFQEGIIDLSNHSLSVDVVHMLGDLLMKLPLKKWKMLNLSGCNISDEGCDLFCELFLSNNVALKINTVDISDNDFYWKSLKNLCKIFQLWKVNKLIMSIEALNDSATMNVVKHFKIKLHNKMSTIGKWYFWHPREELLLTYLPEQNKMIAVFACCCTYKCLICTNCQMDDDDNLIEKLLCFIHHNRKEKDYLPTVTANYYIPSDAINERFSTISHYFHRIVFKELHMHSKGVYKLKQFSEAVNKQPENLVADVLMAAIVHSHSQPNKSYLKTIPVPYARTFKEYLQGHPSILHICASNSVLDNKIVSDIATILSNNNNIQMLCFGGNNLQSVGAVKIAQAMQSISALTLIVLDNNDIGEEAADSIASILSHNTKLQAINFNRNSFQTLGAIKIAKALQHTCTLTKFKIAGNNINKEAADDIATVISNNTNLQELDLSRNNLQTAGVIKIAQALQNTSTLTIFGIACNNVGEDAADDIAAALSRNTKLSELYLNDNNLKSVGIIMIAKVFHNNPSTCTLTNIDLSNNSIGMEESAAENLAYVLSKCHSLMELRLSRNNLQATSVIEIAKSLQKLYNLNTINFSGNNISEEAADDIAAVVSHNKFLTNVDLSNNDLRTNGIIKVLGALKSISSLEELNISCNNVSEEAADDIAAVISHNNRIKDLDLHHNQLQTTGIIIIAKTLETNTTLEVFNISNNNISEEAADDIAAALTNKIMLKM